LLDQLFLASRAASRATGSLRRGIVAIALSFALGPAVAGWTTLGGNAQHTGVSSTPAQSMNAVRWSTPVDLAPPTGTILIHYGSPVITPVNTVIFPVKTGSTDGFRLEARDAGTGSLVWTAATDYKLPPHNWTPSYSPALSGNRVWFAGAGGTLNFRDDVDASVSAASGRVAFYGLAAYQDDPVGFDASVFVNTPITADASGNIYFGFRTVGVAPLGLTSGIARIDTAGNGTWVPASTLSGDFTTTLVPHQAAPALSNDGSTLYVVVAGSAGATAYLVGLDSATLAVRQSSPGVPMRIALKDPRAPNNNAVVSDNSSASPMIGPDGDVYYGVLGNPGNGSRGWMLHFVANLTQAKTPGAFGWDNTASVVSASMVPSYSGTSSYLIFTKYNDYAGFDGGFGINKIAVLDPNDTMVEPHASSNGLLVMKVILSIAGVTPDPDYVDQYPGAVLEWCINAAAVDPATKSVMANSEDGKVYRWDLATNTLSQIVTLSPGIGQAYTSTLIGPDGTVFAINAAKLNAVGSTLIVTTVRSGSGSGGISSNPAGVACGATCSAQFAPGQALTLSAAADPGSIFTGWLGACTGRGSCEFTPAANTTVSASFAPASAAPLSIDVDRNAGYDALSDGLLVIRYLFGLRGPALTAGALGNGAALTDPADLVARLDDLRPIFDIDGNGQVDSLTDGLLLLRHLFGLRGSQLIAGAIGVGATRTTPQDVDNYIQSMMP
jgi:hypothetical protein